MVSEILRFTQNDNEGQCGLPPECVCNRYHDLLLALRMTSGWVMLRGIIGLLQTKLLVLICCLGPLKANVHLLSIFRYQNLFEYLTS